MNLYKKYSKRIIPCIILALAMLTIIIFNSSDNTSNMPTPVIIPDDDTPLSDTIQAKASFYLFNPSEFTATFTNVTPDMADYIGEGTVNFTGDIYNSPDEVASLIVSEPDYSSKLPNEKTVEWGSIYLYNKNKEICVIGLSAEKNDIGPIIVEKPNIEVLPENNPSSVLSFGAKGDGVTDDTAAIKEALKSCPNGEVYFPSGAYVISSSIRIPSNVTIIGEGENSVIIAAPGTSRGATMLKLDKASNVVIKNICISGNSSVNYENMDAKDGIHMLEIWNSDNVTVDSCSFIDNIYAGIRDVGSNNITINNCFFVNIDCGFVTLGSASNIHDLTITNNTFDGHKASEPISLYATSSHSNILIENNTMSNKTGGCGILIPGFMPNNNIIIRNNTLNNIASGMRIQNSSNVQVLHNSVSNTTGGCGIKFISCNNVIVDDNNCSNIRQDGLLVTDCSYITINNLTTTNCGRDNINYFNVRFNGEKNSNISFNNSSIEYSDSKIGICFDCETDIEMDNVEYKNATIWMTKRCVDTTISVPNTITVKDQGSENSIIRN